jgi:hypothetical protein
MVQRTYLDAVAAQIATRKVRAEPGLAVLAAEQ